MVSLEEFKKRMNGLNYEIIKYNGYSKKSLFRSSKHGLFEKKPIHEWHRQLHHDWLKRKYAKENKLKLLIIPYWDFNNIEKIMEIEING